MDILELCGKLPLQTFLPGEALITEGQSAGRLYILVSGEVSVEKNGVSVARLKQPGAVFGEISALLDTKASASVIAKTEVDVRSVENPTAYLSDHPELALHTARILAQRLVDATSYLSDLKRQFEDQSNHFGMMDKILESLLQQQRTGRARAMPADEDASDPRL